MKRIFDISSCVLATVVNFLIGLFIRNKSAIHNSCIVVSSIVLLHCCDSLLGKFLVVCVGVLLLIRNKTLIHYVSSVLCFISFVLAYGTLGALEQGGLEFGQALHRSVIFISLMLFNFAVAYLTRKKIEIRKGGIK